MAGHKKSNEEIATSFFVTKSEIARFFGVSKKVAREVFEQAQRDDIAELKFNYFDESKVRLNTVIEVLGLTVAEVERKKRKGKGT